MTKRKRWQRVITWIVGGMLLFLAAHTLVFPPQGVSAQEDGEEPNPIVLWYAETFGLTYAEAEHRLYLQEEMTLLQIRIMDNEPTYAGSWVGNEPEFGLWVAFASPDAETLIQPYLEGIEWADLVRVEERAYTFVQLEEIQEQVILVAYETGIPFASGIAPPNVASITLFTPHVKELRAQLEADATIQPYLDLLNFVYQESLPVPAVEEAQTFAFTTYLPIFP